MDWYELAQGTELFQGDILLGCPVLKLASSLTWPIPSDFEKAFQADIYDLAVLTQSCDLANNKTGEVLLARVLSWKSVVQSQVERGNTAVQGSKFRKLVLDGNIPSLSLLHKREESPSLPWSVVDFHHLFTLQKSFLVSFAAVAGPRLRLRSPYREHLAQAFARYFMRVGLPHDARSFEKEGGES